MRAADPDLAPADVLALLQATGECPDGALNAMSAGVCSGQGQWWYDPDGIAEPLINAPRAATAAGDAPDPTDPEPEPEPEPDPDPDDPTEISLTASGHKIRGLQKVDLVWSGATSGDVDIVRDGATLTTVSNSGAYTDNIDVRGGGSYTYQVCEAGTTVCSEEVTVTF
jgi:hypothetical protein